MKSKPTYKELEKENIKLRKELDENFKIEETSLLDNILRSSTEMSVAVTDIDLNVTFFNPKAEEIFGYKASELIGKNLTEIHVMENVDYARVQKAIDIVRQGNIYDYWVKIDNSTGIRTLKSQVRGIWDKKDELVGFVLFTTDMTEQVNAEKEIKKLSTAIEQSANTIMITDTDGKIEYANPKFTEQTGYELKEVIGKNPRILNAKIQSKEYYAEMWQTITAGNTWKGEFCNKTKQGNLYWEQVTITPIKDKGQIINFLAIKEDITARKKAELDLQKQIEEYETLNEEYKTTNEDLLIAKEKAEESDQLKTEFINNMSHEIRTPLNGILGFAQFLNSPDLTEKTRKQYVDIINNSSNQLLKIIEDILEISQLKTKQVKINEKEICLNDLLLELFSVFDIKAKENKTPLYLNKGLSDNESVILTDKIKLNKILSNLLENALKFTTEGFIEFGYQLKDSKLEIYVKDTGIGIKQESQKTIFDRFSQEEKELSQKVGGLGLGLSLAKENAELLGGKITLHSKKEEGATFYVTIPYKPVNSKTGNDNSSINKTKRTKIQDNYTILIVEDEEVNYLYLDILLGKFELNFETLHAKHGKEAVEICKENSEIDLVLMDMKMPIMNGFEATKLIKEFRPTLPIVAQTAYSTNDERKQAFSVGCDDFITKPINKENLKEIMIKHLIFKK